MTHVFHSNADGQFVFEAVVAGRRVTLRLDHDALAAMVHELEETPVARTEMLNGPTDSRTVSAPGISLKVQASKAKPWLTTSFSFRKQ